MKNTLTFRALDSSILHKVQLGENTVIRSLRMMIINNKLMSIYRKLDGINDPWYHKTTTLAAAADTFFGKDSGGTFALSAVDPTTHFLTRTSGSWVIGTLITVSFYNSSTGARVCDFVGRITTVVGGTQGFYTILVGSDAGMTISGTRYTIVEIKGVSAALDISGLYVKSILKIYDNSYTGGKMRLFTEIKDPKLFALLHRDPVFSGRVAYFHRGDSIDIFVGATAPALGTIQFEYRGKPQPCVDFDSDVFIDIPPEDNQTLLDEVTSEYLQAAQREAPTSKVERVTDLQEEYSAAGSDESTKQSLKGQRSG